MAKTKEPMIAHLFGTITNEYSQPLEFLDEKEQPVDFGISNEIKLNQLIFPIECVKWKGCSKNYICIGNIKYHRQTFEMYDCVIYKNNLLWLKRQLPIYCHVCKIQIDSFKLYHDHCSNAKHVEMTFRERFNTKLHPMFWKSKNSKK